MCPLSGFIIGRRYIFFEGRLNRLCIGKHIQQTSVRRTVMNLNNEFLTTGRFIAARVQ